MGRREKVLVAARLQSLLLPLLPKLDVSRFLPLPLFVRVYSIRRFVPDGAKIPFEESEGRTENWPFGRRKSHDIERSRSVCARAQFCANFQPKWSSSFSHTCLQIEEQR